MIPGESIVVFWNTVMILLGILVVLGPVLGVIIYVIDRKIVSPEYQKIKEGEK
jgi:hypothetical protein